jgi:predicted nucleic acid-binding Zn ribbon protein
MEEEYGKPRSIESLNQVMSQLFAVRGWGKSQDRLRLERAWAESVEPAQLPFTRVLAIKRGVIEIEVKSAILMQELTQFHKRRLLTLMKEKLSTTNLTNIRFKAGSW